jgi:putative phosphoribosyl transferase
MISSLFLNRKEAGELLADRLGKYISQNPAIFALPRGGVPVAFEISAAFGEPIIPLIVRKITAPNEPELAIGAIGEEDVQILNIDLLKAYIDEYQLKEIIEKEKNEIDRRIRLYRDNRGLPPLMNKTAIIVDDGLATGLTCRVAIEIVKKHSPKKIVLALPVCSQPSIEQLSQLADEVICLEYLTDFTAIGNYYYDFTQVTDEEVLGYLKSSEINQDINVVPDLPTSPEDEGEQALGGTMTDLEADDDTEKAARNAGIKTSRVHR